VRKIIIAAVVLMLAGSVLYAQERPPRPERPRREGPRDIDQAKERIEEMLRAAEQAEKEGNERRAQQLRKQVEQMKRRLEGARPDRDKPRREEPEVSLELIRKDWSETKARAIKLRAGRGDNLGSDIDNAPGRTEKLIKMAREMFGDKMVLMIDGNGSYSVKEAIRIYSLWR